MQETNDTNLESDKDTANIKSELNINSNKSILKKLLTVLIIFTLLVFCGIFIGLYINEKNQNNDSNSMNDYKSTLISKTEETVNDKTTYTAIVGKFLLELADTYAIIVKVDGPFEGGPATQLQVGSVASGSNNVIDSPALGEITITAIPASNYGNNFEAFLASTFDEQLATPIDSNVTFDGVETDAYRVDSLATTEIYVFENQGIYYQVSFDSPDQENFDSIKNDIINGFTFVE